MDKYEIVAILRDAFDKQVSSHHSLDLRSRELDWYLKNYIEKIEEVIGEMEK